MLFSEIARTDTRPMSYGEPLFAYLDSSGRISATNARQILNTWFEHYPDREKEEFANRFRSSNNTSFLSAFFELYLHELLRRLGYKLTIHPSLSTSSSKHPDFLADNPGGNDFYLESVVAFDISNKEAAQKALMNVVYDAINTLNSPNFFLKMTVRGSPNTQPPGTKIRSALSDWLGQLNVDEVTRLYVEKGITALPHMSLRYGSCTMKFSALPKSQEARGKPGARPLGIHMPAHIQIDRSKEVIKKSLVKKRPAQYGDFDKPYVIAVNAAGMNCDYEDSIDALFGDQRWAIPQTLDKAELIPMPRKQNGFWWGRSGCQNKRVSAVLITNLSSPSQIAKADICVFHNPWAKYPLRGELSQLTEAIPEKERIRFKQGKHPKEIFDLPDIWPGEK